MALKLRYLTEVMQGLKGVKSHYIKKTRQWTRQLSHSLRKGGRFWPCDVIPTPQGKGGSFTGFINPAQNGVARNCRSLSIDPNNQSNFCPHEAIDVAIDEGNLLGVDNYPLERSVAYVVTNKSV